MNFLSKFVDKLYLKQWTVGIAESSMEDIIKNKEINSTFKWIPLNNNYQFFADPFIFKLNTRNYAILFEELDYKKQYGYICQFNLNDHFEIISKKVLLETQTHLSYPFIFYENNEMYVFPESSANGKLSCYHYDYKNQSLSFVKDILDLPLLDSTILKHDGNYWIFCTMSGKDSNNKLYIYYSKNLFGPYVPHQKNPVKNDLNGSRPAGDFVQVDRILYRPTQGSEKYYGSSINIFKITTLSEENFEEEFYMSIKPDKNEKFNFGIHTINGTEGTIVVDGLLHRFSPFAQLGAFYKKLEKKFNK